MNCPSPLPSEVFESEIEGLAFRPQQTPLAVMSAPPSDEITPPLEADVAEILAMEEVDNVGISSFLQEMRYTKEIARNRIKKLIDLFIMDDRNLQITTGGHQIYNIRLANPRYSKKCLFRTN